MQKFFRQYFIIMILVFVAALFGIFFFFFARQQYATMPHMNIPFLQNQGSIIPISNTQSISGHNLDPVVSNQWYSSIYKDFPTQPFYALPLSYVISKDGLGFSYPDIVTKSDTIFGSYVEDFTIGYEKAFSKPKITHIGDWDIGVNLVDKRGNDMQFDLAHGVPTVTIITSLPTVQINIPNKFAIYNHNAGATSSATFSTTDFVLSTRNHNYLFVLPKNSSISQTDKQIELEVPQKIYVALLDNRSNYNLFLSNAFASVTNTVATPEIKNSALITTYTVYGSSNRPLIALYPHQFDFLNNKPEVLATYDTIRGPLKLITADSFTTQLPLVTPPLGFTKVNGGQDEIRKQIVADIKSVITNPIPQSKDYTLGTWFGKVDDLLLLADTYQLEKEKQQLLQFVVPIFIKSLDYFHYDSSQTSLIANVPEFGNEKLNDHHFHYGYYLRTAAVLAHFDPSQIDTFKNSLSEMVGDIANDDRSSTDYPYLRNFDIYEGHSWADGYADFADGNNQESSSEAINAWYGVYLWAQTIKDTKLAQTALYLYNTEIQSTIYYWFDVNNFYQPPYLHSIASIIWGGKVDYASWFSKETNMKYGIELLPITPASDYLGTIGTFQDYDNDYHLNGGDETKDWGDLFTIWKSYYDPQEALQMKDKVQKLEEMNPRSLFLYELYLHNK